MENRKINMNVVALCVGIYDTAVGLWPLLSMNTFSDVTRLTQHLEIVRMLGSAWAVLGVALLVSQKNRKVIPLLGVASTVAGSSLALAQIAMILMRIISPVFLVQSLCETIIGITWIATLASNREEIKAEIADRSERLSGLVR